VNVAGQISRDPGSLFKILDSSEIALIAEAEKRHAGSDEALAALYLKHGLLIEALGPLRRLHARTQDPRLVKYLKAAAGPPEAPPARRRAASGPRRYFFKYIRYIDFLHFICYKGASA
jgi:hypothetical protein